MVKPENLWLNQKFCGLTIIFWLNQKICGLTIIFSGLTTIYLRLNHNFSGLTIILCFDPNGTPYCYVGITWLGSKVENQYASQKLLYPTQLFLGRSCDKRTLSWIRGVRGHSPIFKQKHSILGLDFDLAYKELVWNKNYHFKSKNNQFINILSFEQKFY